MPKRKAQNKVLVSIFCSRWVRSSRSRVLQLDVRGGFPEKRERKKKTHGKINKEGNQFNFSKDQNVKAFISHY